LWQGTACKGNTALGNYAIYATHKLTKEEIAFRRVILTAAFAAKNEGWSIET
jgi:hypothetical protein